MRVKKIFFILFIFAAISISPLNLPAFTSWNVLNKSGYKIHYSNADSEYALNLSEYIENNFIKIKNFIGYEPDRHLNIYLVQPGLKGGMTNFINAPGDGITIFVDEDYNKSINLIWQFSIDETISLLHDKSSGFSIQKWRGYESWLSQALANYLSEGFTTEDDMILRSLIAQQIPLSINSPSPEQFTGIENQALYRGFIYFVDKSYGKDAVISSLKNISYYGGFLKSLGVISGRNLTTIEKDFNVFFVSRYSEIIKKPALLTHKTEIINLNNSYILAANQEGGVISYNNLINNIEFFLSDSATNSNELKNIASIPFNSNNNGVINGSFYGDNECVITVTEGGGTSFYLYNISDLSLKQKIFIPYLFLRELSGSHFEDGIVFSGTEGGRNDIFTLKTGSMQIEKVTSGKGFYCYPAVFNKEKIIFVEKSDKNIIYEIDQTGQSMILLWETADSVKDIVASEKGDILFSWNRDGVFNIYTLNVSGEKASALTDYNTGAFNPLFYKNKKIIINIYAEREFKWVLIDNDI